MSERFNNAIIWKPINGYENLYHVSLCGKIRNARNTKILQPVKQNNGYLYITLCKNGEKRLHRIHRLVALAFLDNPDNLPVVHHIDENKENNDCNNLQWVTYQENTNRGSCIAKRVKNTDYSAETRKQCANGRRIYRCNITAGGYWW